MIKIKITILSLLTLIFISCTKEEAKSKSTSMTIKIGEDPLELTSSYYKNNEDYYLDNVSLNVKSANLLEDMFDIDFKGDYDQIASFQPNQPGTYSLDLIVKDNTSGAELDVSNFQISVMGNPLPPSSNIKKKEELVIQHNSKVEEEIKVQEVAIKEVVIEQKDNEGLEYLYYVQASAWNKKEEALLEKTKLEEEKGQPFVEEHTRNNTSMWRVRFGPFMSREEAMQKASKLNIKNPWIDKVVQIEKKKPIEVENLIDYEEEKKKTIEVENLIDYEEEKKKTIEVEELINYENLEDSTKSKDDKEHFIQVTTSSSANKVEKNKKYLESFGYAPFIQETKGRNNRIWYKLKLGPYDIDTAEKISDEIFENLGLEVRINNE